ncbi:PEP-utilizing family enzyme [Caldanaerobacter subterraneus]|uniref:PEP-utilizing family enzyme n=1 Tax=Caldanaerobacter subterraneus TaxID=911092 RepID=A0A4R2JQR7_9THEO|nr:PEP-utilizing family enzyme [Caldanaerobacter subterraneus]
MLKGVAASPGIAIGKAFLYTKEKVTINVEKIEESKVEEEIAKFRKALEVTQEEIKKIKEKPWKNLEKKKQKFLKPI